MLFFSLLKFSDIENIMYEVSVTSALKQTYNNLYFDIFISWYKVQRLSPRKMLVQEY